MTHLNKDKREFPGIHLELESAKQILSLSIKEQIQVEVFSAK